MIHAIVGPACQMVERSVSTDHQLAWLMRAAMTECITGGDSRTLKRAGMACGVFLHVIERHAHAGEGDVRHAYHLRGNLDIRARLRDRSGTSLRYAGV